MLVLKDVLNLVQNRLMFVGRGGGQVVSVLAFYSNNPSSNLAEAYNFFCKIT